MTASRVRALHAKILSQHEKRVTETMVRSELLPLSVCERKGFDIEMIAERAGRQRSELFLVHIFCSRFQHLWSFLGGTAWLFLSTVA